MTVPKNTHMPGLIPCVENLNIIRYVVEPRTTELETVPVDSEDDTTSVESTPKHATNHATEYVLEETVPPNNPADKGSSDCSENAANNDPVWAIHMEVTKTPLKYNDKPDHKALRGRDS